MSLYDNFICENEEDKCYHVKPFSKLTFGGINPNTGKAFNEDDINKISNHYFNSCASKGGKISYCCNPFESEASQTKLTPEIMAKYPHIRLNRDNNKLNSIDICNETDIGKCPGNDWKKPVSYEVCKMEGGEKIKGKNNVDTIVNLRKDCYSIHCNPQEPEMSVSNFIGLINDNTKSTYYDDINIADVIKLDSVQALIKDYDISDINRKLTHNDRGETMLHEAVRQGASKVVAFLVGRGADLNVQNVQGDTPLHLGARFDKKNLVYALLNYGAKINIVNSMDEVPMFDAVKHASIDMVRILFNHGGDIYQQNNNGDTLLHIVIMYAVKDKKDKVQFLVERGVNIIQKNKDGLTAMDVARDMVNENEQDIMSNIMLEGFECLTSFKKQEKYYNEDVPHILTYLEKVNYKQNKDKYQDFIIGKLPEGSFIEFDNNVCVGGNKQGRETTKEECIKEGGNWTQYNNDSNKVKVKTEYLNESEINLANIPDSELYRSKCNEAQPLQLLPHMTGELDLTETDKNNLNSNQNSNQTSNKNNQNNNKNNRNNKNNKNNKNNNNQIEEIIDNIEGFSLTNSNYKSVIMISIIMAILFGVYIKLLK